MTAIGAPEIMPGTEPAAGNDVLAPDEAGASRAGATEVLAEPSEGDAAALDGPFIRAVVPAVPALPEKPRLDDPALRGVTRVGAVRGGREEA